MAYQRDPRGPLERLYGFEKIQAARQEMQKQQAMQQQREQILRESYQPGEEARTEYDFQQAPQQGGMSNIMGALGIADAPQMQAKQIEGKPAQFDREGAINRLYGVGDMETAQSLVNDDYRQSLGNRAANGGAEKWFGNGKLVTGTDGKKYNQLTSSAGNTKLVPLEGDLTGELKPMNLGGRQVWVNSYTGEPVREFDVTATDYQQFQMDPVAQGKVAEAEAAGRERGESDAKGQFAAESSVPIYDKTLGIIDELINHPGRSWGTGGSALLNVAPGTQGYDFKTKLAQLSGQNFLTEIQRMKGQGSLSDAEGKRLESASAAMDAAQSEPEFLKQLKQLQSELQFYKQRAERKAAGGAAPAPAPAPAPRPAPGRAPVAQSQAMPSLPNPAQHKGRIARDQKTGIRYQSNGSQWMRVK